MRRRDNLKFRCLKHAYDNDIFAALSAAADGYCLKEASGDQIAMAIRTVSTGAAWLHPRIATRFTGGLPLR